MKYNLLLLTFTFFLTFGAKLHAQEPIQLSGVVLTDDSIPQFVPYAHVMVKKRMRGTLSNEEGFFSFAAMPGDTLEISVIGFKTELLLLPDTLEMEAYLSKVIMQRDTTILQEVTLYPWPTPDRFKAEFLAMRVPTTQNDIAMRNLAIQELKARAAAMGYSADEIQDFMIQQQQQNIYDYGRYGGYANGGTALLGALTNPFAWSEFFQAVKRGDYSR